MSWSGARQERLWSQGSKSWISNTDLLFLCRSDSLLGELEKEKLRIELPWVKPRQEQVGYMTGGRQNIQIDRGETWRPIHNGGSQIVEKLEGIKNISRKSRLCKPWMRRTWEQYATALHRMNSLDISSLQNIILFEANRTSDLHHTCSRVITM